MDSKLIYNIEKLLAEYNSNIKFKLINVKEIIFEENVKMQCYYCSKFNNNWRCPPNIPQNIDYKKMILEFTNAALVYIKMDLNQNNNFEDVRRDSSLILHKALLEIESYLWSNNIPNSLTFVGGSCKLCKNGCGKEKCNNPGMARTPLEAIGVNVIKSAEKAGISIAFPPKESLLRVGLLLW